MEFVGDQEPPVKVRLKLLLKQHHNLFTQTRDKPISELYLLQPVPKQKD